MDVLIECPCPERAGARQHPAGDTVTLKETLEFRAATAIRNDAQLQRQIDPDLSMGEWLAILTEGYVLYGIEAWTLRDEKGKPLPVSRAAIRDSILTNLDTASKIADAADGLYSSAVMLPLLKRASPSSTPTPTNGSTSKPRSAKNRTPSSPSSTTSTPTAATATTSPALAGEPNS